jgi:hypothetical protein
VGSGLLGRTSRWAQPCRGWSGPPGHARRRLSRAEHARRVPTPASIRSGTTTVATAGRPTSCDGPAQSRGRPSRRATAYWPRAQAQLQRRSTATTAARPPGMAEIAAAGAWPGPGLVVEGACPAGVATTKGSCVGHVARS